MRHAWHVSSAPRGLHGALIHDLGRKIVGGAHPAGVALSLDGLCAEYQASRPTVREALRVLESKGLLKIRQSLGTRVQPVDQWNLLDADVVAWRLAGGDRAQQVRELLQMRLAVEPVAAGLAAQVPDPSIVARLEAALTAMRAAADDGDLRAFTEADVEFHATLLSGCGNRMFPLLTVLVATALEAREQALTQHHVDLSVAALEQHGAVIAAIRRGDPESAEQQMRAMLRALQHEETPVGP
jgi:DNA-binding FadR family transcriptional regulator